MSRGVGHRRSSDLALLWVWRRPAATTLTRPPSLGTSIFHRRIPKKKKKKKQREKKERKKEMVGLSEGQSQDIVFLAGQHGDSTSL